MSAPVSRRLRQPDPTGRRSFDALLVVWVIVIVVWAIWHWSTPVHS